MELPPGFLEADWSFKSEIELLQCAQAMNDSLDAKIRSLAHDFRAHRFYPRRTEVRALRLHLHHTFTPPVPASEDGATPGAPGRWTLHLQATDPVIGGASPVNLVNYFRKASIELDPRLYSDSMVEWTCFQKGNHEANVLEVSRVGHTPHTVRMKLLPSHAIDRYTLSDELQAALAPYFVNMAVKSFTKSDIIMATWEYIKRKNLIKEDDCRVAVCDGALRQLFNCDSLPFASIVMALRPHLTSAPAIDFEYELTLTDAADHDASTRLNEQVVRVDVGHVDEVEKAREIALQEWEELHSEQQKELDLLHRQEAQIVAQLHAYHRKHEWMQQFAKDPAGFVADLVKSQQADQQILTAEAETDEINMPHPHQFTQPWVREVVSELLIPPPSN